LYKEYHLSEIQKFGVQKFIKDLVADKHNKKVDRVREWLMKKINGKMVISDLPFQKGCPGIVPGLRGKPWW